MDKNNNYYIYEWYNSDNFFVFYVGRGTGNRLNVVKERNVFFTNYYNKYNCKVRKTFEGLTYEESCKIEKDLIRSYREKGMCKCNIADGGKGGNGLKGESNPMFGRTWWTSETPKEKIEDWKKGVASSGCKNGQYGISPKERMSEEVYK